MSPWMMLGFTADNCNLVAITLKIKMEFLLHTNEGDSLLVEHSTWQQVEIILHRVHHHSVTCVVASLQTD